MTLFRRFLAVPLALSAASGALAQTAAAPHTSPRAPATAAKHMLFAVHGPHATVYLLGSVHLLTPDAGVLPAVIDSAFAHSSRVVFEANMDTLQARGMELMSRGRLPQGTTLRDVVDAKTYAKLDSMLPRYGLATPQVASMKPWMLSLVLSQLTMMRAGFQPQFGVDMQLAKLAHATAKPIGGLESADFQLGLFDTISPADQNALLDESLIPPDSALSKITHLRDAWLHADMHAIDSMTTDGMAGHPALLATMLTDRTQRWVPQVEEMLRGSGDVMVVVGAGHLVGKTGLVALLKAKGYAITQM